jgi:hypothetical protein
LCNVIKSINKKIGIFFLFKTLTSSSYELQLTPSVYSLLKSTMFICKHDAINYVPVYIYSLKIKEILIKWELFTDKCIFTLNKELLYGYFDIILDIVQEY